MMTMMADCLIPFTERELDDLLEAIGDAQDELCVDLEGNRFPEGTAYYRRLEALAKRLRGHNKIMTKEKTKIEFAPGQFASSAKEALDGLLTRIGINSYTVDGLRIADLIDKMIDENRSRKRNMP